MCKLMGWSMSSRMPDRYIDRGGVAEEEALEAIRRDDLAKSEEVTIQLRRRIAELKRRNSELEKQSMGRNKADTIMTKLLLDKDVQKILISKIKELGLANDILRD